MNKLLMAIGMAALLSGCSGMKPLKQGTPHPAFSTGCVMGDQPEDPRAARASIYPHPPPPDNLKIYNLDFTVKINKGNAIELGLLRVEQPRPTGGFWFSIACPLEGGKFISAVKLSPELKEVLLILLDPYTSQQIAHAKVPIGNLKGQVWLQPNVHDDVVTGKVAGQ